MKENIDQSINIEGICDDIANGTCVLFLGPELLVNRDQKYYKSYFKELAHGSRDISKYFSKDNLFSISGQFPTLKRQSIISQVSKFYENVGDEIILNLIARIPFPLIINVSPDTAINEVFSKNKYKYREAYFPDPSVFYMELPTKEDPVIYNIFGSIQSKQSLIITHDDLFKRVKELMNNKVPEKIDKCLKAANSFIFLGVKFETWYYQLLLSILDIDKSNSARFGTPDENDEDTVSVMNSHFQIAFVKNNPLKLIQNIYDCITIEDKNILRNVPNDVEPPKKVAYISYAWKDEENSAREILVNKIYDELTSNHRITVLRDRNVMTMQDSIESFMNRIGRGKIVIIVVSEKYLKSEYCMYEAWQIYKNANSENKVFLVVLPDAKLNAPDVYIQYWIDKANAMTSKIEEKFSQDILAVDKLVLKAKSIMYIYLFIGEFLKILNDTLHFKVTNENQTDAVVFGDFIKDIVQKLKDA